MIVLEKKNKIYENEPRLKLEESLKENEVLIVKRNYLSRQGLALSIEQKNIRNLNEKINYDKINSLLIDKDINAAKKRDIKKYETKLKALRELYINDLVKREKYMTDLTKNIYEEKEKFFDIVRGKKNEEPQNN